MRRWTPLVENIAESTAACVITMAQGNLFAITAAHWIIASRTGVIAGAIATFALFALGTRRRWVAAAVLGALTAGVDFMVHPGAFGPVFAEAVVTGAAAAALSLAVHATWSRLKWRSAKSA